MPKETFERRHRRKRFLELGHRTLLLRQLLEKASHGRHLSVEIVDTVIHQQYEVDRRPGRGARRR